MFYKNLSLRIGNSWVRFINLWARFVKPREQFKNSWVWFINWGDELQNRRHVFFSLQMTFYVDLSINIESFENNY